MTVLNILMQNPEATFDGVVGSAVTLRHGDADEAAPAQEPEGKTYTIDEIEL